MRLRIKQDEITLLGLLAIFGEAAFALIGFQGLAATIYSFLFLIIIPGWLMSRAFGWDFKGGAKQFIHIPALSLAFLIMAGLLTNATLQAFRVPAPLAADHLLLFIIPVLLALILAGYHRTRGRFFLHTFQMPSQLRWILIPVAFPILAVLGATLQNNGGSNLLTLILLGSFCIYVLIVTARHKSMTDAGYISTIFFGAMALLFMTSLRSWHITGFDINQEFEVFQLTRVPLEWSMAHLRDPYNACLSITILPTLFTQLTNIADEYVFKAAFQIIFALMPVAVFVFARRLFPAAVAFLAAFFIIGQISFFQGMPTLIRQEFAMLFFVLFIATIFDRQIRPSMRHLLIVIYGAAMVLSHYSTSYVAFALLGISYLAHRLLSTPGGQAILRRLHLRNRRVWRIRTPHHIRIWHLLVLLACVAVWNLGVTRTSSGLTEFLSNSGGNISAALNPAALITAAKKTLAPAPSAVNLDEYIKTFTDFKASHDGLVYYPTAAAAVHDVHVVKFATVPAALGARFHQLADAAFKIDKLLINNIFILIGTLYLFVRWQRGKFRPGEYPVIALASFALIALLLILPGALKEYNLERLYFQQLVTWAPLSVIGGLAFIWFIKSLRIKYMILASLYIMQLLFYSGFVFNFTGGPALISTTNYGEDYEKFYTHEAEVASAKWLSERVGELPVFTSSPGRNKLEAFAGIPATQIVSQTYPTIIDRYSYVYLTYINTVGGKSTFVQNGDEYTYNFQSEFFDANKDKLYSNGVSSIYK